ncbi:MAG: anaerobic ribonucleoside-triphosphate reductase, partial [Promethearchaeota archaeon]
LDADKKQTILEKQLKTLGQKVRIEILRKLKNTQVPIPFSKLQKDILDNNLTSVNLSFHLKTLKRSKLIQSSEEGYSLSLLGEQIIDKILSIEQILNKQNEIKIIRTSKYSKEIFDSTKIEEYLVNEGELERYLAKQIAHEVEERLSKTNIDYMTAPLMREYINAILLENGLEEVRHKLTRLGTPPFKALQLFDSKITKLSPEDFIKRLGSDVSEQFLLLNLLPKNLADLYLSGEIALLNLNYWSLRPIGLYINTETLIDYLFKKISIKPQIIERRKDSINIISNFSNILHQLKQFYTEDLLLGDFNSNFLSYLQLPKIKAYSFHLLATQVIQFNNRINDAKTHLSLDFNYNGKLVKNSSIQNEIDNQFLNSLNTHNPDLIRPLLLFEWSNHFSSELRNEVIKKFITNLKGNNLIIYEKGCSSLFNSIITQIENSREDAIILDKILINLYIISVKAKQNDDLFLDLILDKMNSVFELYKHKERLVQKKLKALNLWNIITTQIFNIHQENLFKNALKSISFFGLNEAILNHCGIELDRTKTSEIFALKILSLMRDLIEERNEVDNNHFILSQPHNDSYLKDTCYNETIHYDQKLNGFSSDLIRNESSLSLDKRILLFKKFQKVINKGVIFMDKMNIDENSIPHVLQSLFNSKISAISLKDCLF